LQKFPVLSKISHTRNSVFVLNQHVWYHILERKFISLSYDAQTSTFYNSLSSQKFGNRYGLFDPKCGV